MRPAIKWHPQQWEPAAALGPSSGQREGGRQLSQIFSLFVRRLQSLISDIRMELIVNEACSVQRAACSHEASSLSLPDWALAHANAAWQIIDQPG